ncbi:hypothetical protein MKZ38_004945 [Zalerion maritima]|uniref:Uncharacterized protein n=1 Tax=Zalerion maritima TaxID=339359 RepID=A0AAD5WRB6_9PEZI|nr:hypothetical protein MKZ38_004945 [Zalerion maritima]
MIATPTPFAGENGENGEGGSRKTFSKLDPGTGAEEYIYSIMSNRKEAGEMPALACAPSVASLAAQILAFYADTRRAN